MPLPARLSNQAKNLWMPMAVVGLAIAIGIGLRSLETVESAYLPKCPLYLLTGWHCTGCGATRACHALVHGDLATAWRSNPLLIAGLPLLGAIWGYRRLQAAAGSPPAPLRPVWIWTILIVLIGYGVLRNVPIYPLTLLAPH